jgi:hypothetical protein
MMCLPRTRYAFSIFDLLLFHMDTDLEQLSELMRRYASGADGAFESLYHGLAPRLYRSACASRNVPGLFPRPLRV